MPCRVMTVLITFNNGTKKEVPIDDWVKAGKLKGYCRANKIKLNQVNEIDYQNESTNQNNSSECKG